MKTARRFNEESFMVAARHAESGGRPPHFKTLARGTERPANAPRLGVRQPPGALGEARKMARQEG